MQRLILRDLMKWKEKRNRKPLIIRGARRVGKTWVMKEFGKQCFAHVVYINFDNNEHMRNVFEMDFDISRIISALKLESRQKIDPEKTLLIFDEIQEVPKALTCLKYFYENAPAYRIIAACSQLGVAMQEHTSFPVGKVNFMNLYPLNFQEFLMAVGEERLAELLEKGDYELMNAFSGKYMDLLRKYCCVGGMPESVQAYLDTDDLYQVKDIQKGLLIYYSDDFFRHAPVETVPHLQMVWSSVPLQLARENKKFMYGLLREGARGKKFELSVQWLMDCSLIHRGYRVKKPGLPLIACMDMHTFKLYFLDVGLLAAACDLDPTVIMEGNRIFTEFKGALTEQFAAQELSASGTELYYYAGENASEEIDFVVQCRNCVVPIEVQAEENERGKSLECYCRKYQPRMAIRTSLSQYREESRMTNVPLYALPHYLKSLRNLL